MDTASSLMIYLCVITSAVTLADVHDTHPIPNPSGTTAPKPKRRSAGSVRRFHDGSNKEPTEPAGLTAAVTRAERAVIQGSVTGVLEDFR